MDDDLIYGCGTSDMKSGRRARAASGRDGAGAAVRRHVLLLRGEEIETRYNGLCLVAETHPELLQADFAVLLEPTYGVVEAGCQGTLRATVTTTGRRAHSARSWLRRQRDPRRGEVLRAARATTRRARSTIDGCLYREGLNAVRIDGGVRRQRDPGPVRDRGQLPVRAGPVRRGGRRPTCARCFEGFDVEITDSAPGALPGLTRRAGAGVRRRGRGRRRSAKLGWTDVSRFAALGIPALNFGPGDPNLAHTREEHVEIDKIATGADAAPLAGRLTLV